MTHSGEERLTVETESTNNLWAGHGAGGIGSCDPATARSATNLLRGFLKRSVLITVILGAIMLAAVPTAMYFNHLSHYETESAEILSTFIGKDLCVKPADLIRDEKRRDATVANINAFMQFGKLVEFKLWSKDQVLVYSFREGDSVGRFHADEPMLAETLRTGRQVSTATVSTNPRLEGLGKLVEVYVPIIVDGKIEGAAEVYRMVPKFQIVTNHVILVVSVSLLFFILLHLLLSGQFKRAAGQLVAYDQELKKSYTSLGLSYVNTIRSLIKALEMRDMETEGHSERVVTLALHIGFKLGLSSSAISELVLGSYLHDIGKIGVPDVILLKPGFLDAEERAVIEGHVQNAVKIIENISFLKPAAAVIENHHERWDGTGYPRGLKAEEIPLTARIFAVVDVYDALTSERPYRRALSPVEARSIIRQEKGGHFDPALVDLFLATSDVELTETEEEVSRYGIHGTVKRAVQQLLLQSGASPA